MQHIGILAAALAAYGFGAVWYMLLAPHWVKAAGVAVDESGQPINKGDPRPYLVAFASCLFVAAMMRFVFMKIGVDGPSEGLLGGLAIGLFLAVPWLATCYAFAGRQIKLTLIDGGYAAGGSALSGLVLTLV
jgi:hypothetical protein